jgi:hypothetical protein
MFNKWQLNKMKPVLKWPPPPEEKMDSISEGFAKSLGLTNGEKDVDITNGFEKALEEKPKFEASTLPGICPECGKHIGSCRCPVVGECLHKQTKNMSWPDGSHSEVCIKCLYTRLLWEQGETEWQDHKYKTLSGWYAEALEVQKRWEKI